jgi:hypothetical protein
VGGRAAVKAAISYFVIVFVVGFALGSIRVLVLVPEFGETSAVLFETPFMLVISWVSSQWSTSRFSVPATVSARSLMGAAAFLLLMLAETGVSIFIFERSLAAYFAVYETAAGAVGLAAQVAFAAFPLMQMRHNRH